MPISDLHLLGRLLFYLEIPFIFVDFLRSMTKIPWELLFTWIPVIPLVLVRSSISQQPVSRAGFHY